jgi:hypothetical protein
MSKQPTIHTNTREFMHEGEVSHSIYIRKVPQEDKSVIEPAMLVLLLWLQEGLAISFVSFLPLPSSIRVPHHYWNCLVKKSS